MNKQLASVIWVEALIAFFIPFGTTLATALGPYVAITATLPSKIGWLVMIIGAAIAGASALKSFLSTTVSDAKDDIATQQTTLPLNQPPTTETHQ